MDRITVIHNSLVVFVCGLIGLLPVLGSLPALYALVLWRKVRVRYRDEWNPASAYLDVGVALALLGLLGLLLLISTAVLTSGR